MIRAADVPARIAADDLLTRSQASAEEIVARARVEAETLLATAEADLGARREQARREGLEHARAEASALLIAAREAHHDALADLHRTLSAVAIAAACRLVNDALDAEPERIVPIVEEALAPVRRATRVVLHVHPDDASALASMAERRGVVLQLDSTLRRGGCVVESNLGRVDSRLEVRADALVAALDATDGPQAR